MQLTQAISWRAEHLRRVASLSPVYVRSAAEAVRTRRLFDSVERFCIFIGYPRSGHTLIGSLLNAHPQIVLSHELNVLKYVGAGFSKAQMYSLILGKDRWWVANGCMSAGYSYEVPGQWQGKFTSIRVIGDKRGGYSSLMLATNPGLLDRLEKLFGDRLRVIHIVRNPYDNIATMFRRAEGNRTLPFLVKRYLDEMCGASERTLEFAGPERSITMRHEDFLEDPRGGLRELCGFLGQDAPEDFLDACVKLVRPSSNRTRHTAPWTPELLDQVRRGTERYAFLSSYGPE